MSSIHSSRRLICMQQCLTILFILAQLSFFMIHYNVTELVDSLVNSSLLQAISYPVVFFPILLFIFIQLIAYCLWASWLAFITISNGELFKLSNIVTYGLGIIFWVVGMIAMLSLNFHYFPGSFFAEPFYYSLWLNKSNHFILIVLLIILTTATLLAYINYFYYKRHLFFGGIFLLFGLVVGIVWFYNYFLLFTVRAPYHQTKPNIIMIGLDSLRPDFTGYFGHPTIHTPNIDHFLQTGVTVTQAYTPLARTFPAWVSILTGKYPKHTGARNNLVDIRQLAIKDTLAKRLQQAGYETIYATDEKRFSNITKEYGFDQVIGPSMGINDFLLGGLTDFPMSNLLLKLPIARFLFPYQYANRAASVTYNPNDFLQLVDYALKQVHQPLFLAIHLCLSHWPFTWAGDNQPIHFIMPERYTSSVEAIDRQLGDLLHILKKNKILDHSFIVLLSDHGTTLGLPHDRFIEKKNYVGDLQQTKKITMARLSAAPHDSLDFKHDYTMETSYGQATDVLSLKQYQIVLALKSTNSMPHEIKSFTLLMDIAPTILDYLKLPPLENADGLSFISAFSTQDTSLHSLRKRFFFIETGDTLSEIETDDIHIEKVVQRKLNVYQVNAQNGLLFINPNNEKYIIQAKQRAILQGNWMLVYYPRTIQTTFSHLSFSTKLIPTMKWMKPYYVLVDLKSGAWTMDMTLPLVQRAPIAELKLKLKGFYGDEIV